MDFRRITNHRFQILDPAIAATILLRGWGIMAGVISLLLISTSFSKIQQGYYYTFASLLALQIFFELGLNFVITQFVSHESIGLIVVADLPESSNKAAERIAGIYLFIHYWFKRIAFAFVVLVGLGGILFISGNAEVPPAYWRLTWFTLCLATGINLYFSPQLAIVEGLGRVKEVARLRLLQAVVGNFFFWGVLLLTRELLAAAMVPLIAALTTPWWLKKTAFINDVIDRSGLFPQSIDWRNQIFPMQWRIALSWISGYLIFQLITPTIFHHSGAAAAGQVGISLAVFTQITNISMSWIIAKAPYFGNLVAAGKRFELRSLFRKLVVVSTAFNLFGVSSALIGATTLKIIGSHYTERILPLTDLIILGAVALVNHLTFAMATYMRSHKTEPMLMNSVISAVLIAASTLIFAQYGVRLVLCGYLLTSAMISLPWSYQLFRPFWNGTKVFKSHYEGTL